jgi:hypothetical protein
LKHRLQVPIFLLLLNVALLAQLSPGDLHQSHAHLEGLQNCTKCHAAGAQISLQNCLSCHNLLSERIQNGKGLHARPEFENCVQCHSDHHGRDFKMIYWKDGQENFDHSLTGYRLEGKHSEIKCRDCHKPANIPDPKPLLAQKKKLSRTFLGLDQSCLSCHTDEHRGQLSKDCLTCHTFKDWKPAEKFNHDKAKFKLTGSHKTVKCESCHPSVRLAEAADSPMFTKFVGIKFANCFDCHNDPHNGRLGKSCQKCHSTAGWEKILESANFNHDLTRFPLRGLHRNVACESCHKPEKSRRGLAFANCTDCHADFHKGQFAKRAGGIACENCHTVEGFSPAKFTIADHAKSDFPLEGAHRAVPCIACHAGDVGGKRSSRRSMLRINRFTFKSTACADCHKDPHFWEVEKFTATKGCQACHKVDSWRNIKFDHLQTGFALNGKHVAVQCITCHQPVALRSGAKKIGFKNLKQDCQSCHEDVHNGQFALVVGNQLGGVTTCADCHSETNWEPSKFDHNRDARFKLDGAHARLRCEACHSVVEENGKQFRHFKPMKFDCADCHGS